MKLTIDFTYDHTSGLYYALLENGSCIPVSRNDVAGKLENVLSLFRRAVIRIEHPDQSRRFPQDDTEIIQKAEGLVQKVGVFRPAKIDLTLLERE